MSATVDLKFRNLESDYVRALRSYYATRTNLPLDLVAIVVMLGAGAYLWDVPSLRWHGVAAVALATTLAIVLFAAFMVVPRLVFRNEAKLRDDYSLTFSADGIHFRTAQIDSQLQWSLYTHALIVPHSYILFYGPRQMTIIPTRVFANAEQRAAFDELVTQHIPRITRRG